MNISELFVKRPVTTTLLMLGILVFGAMAYRLLPVSDLPSIDFPTIQVNAGLPGASPETMASAVALPLEKQFATISGLNSINSTSSQGSTNIVLQFDLSRDIDAAAQDVQAMIAKAARQLPPQMPAPPSYQKVNPADQPVMFLVTRSATLPLSTLDEYAETGAAAYKVDGAGWDSVEQKSAQEHTSRNTRPEFEVGSELATQGIEVSLRFLRAGMRFVQNHLTGQVARPHGVIQTFAGDRIHQASGIADREPTLAGDAVLLPGRGFERRKHVTVEGCAFVRDAFLVHVALQARAQRLGRLALAADSHRKMPATGEDPDIALQLRQKLDVDMVFLDGHVVAESGHRIGRGQLGAYVAQ